MQLLRITVREHRLSTLFFLGFERNQDDTKENKAGTGEQTPGTELISMDFKNYCVGTHEQSGSMCEICDKSRQNVKTN